jgi:preprotein translocase subunit SecA
MRIFASEKVSTLMKKMGMNEGEAIEHNWVTRAIENAQKKVEGHNFDIRKHLLDYDDVANEQRKYIYNKRDEFLKLENRIDIVNLIIEEVFSDIIESYINEENVDKNEINDILQRDFHLDIDAKEIIANSTKKEEAIIKFISKIHETYEKNISEVSKEAYLELIKEIFINIVDKNWIEHIQSMDYLRQGIGLRSYAQKNPKQEYKREAFEMFSIMQSNLHYSFVSLIFRIDYNSTYIKKESHTNVNLIHSESNDKISSSENKSKHNKNVKKRNRKRNKQRRKRRK